MLTRDLKASSSPPGWVSSWWDVFVQRGHLSVLSSCHLCGTSGWDSFSGSRTADFPAHRTAAPTWMCLLAWVNVQGTSTLITTRKCQKKKKKKKSYNAKFDFIDSQTFLKCQHCGIYRTRQSSQTQSPDDPDLCQCYIWLTANQMQPDFSW